MDDSTFMASIISAMTDTELEAFCDSMLTDVILTNKSNKTNKKGNIKHE